MHRNGDNFTACPKSAIGIVLNDVDFMKKKFPAMFDHIFTPHAQKVRHGYSDTTIQFGEPDFLKDRIIHRFKYIFLRSGNFFVARVHKWRYFYFRPESDATTFLSAVSGIECM